ncbi:unnamed protein product [Paramecium sonneborni]|uniref:Uncharacterized protein n=1 Tax=Paramecium sonneborni TaxID=65129 RepID=A0A8S1K651_9CILI|nr:unnamed protein product [Paramecium sonneborni]
MNKLQFIFKFCTESQKSIYKLENSQKYIADLVQKTDWISFAISKHIPKQVRQDYLNICQFHNELARIEETSKERSLGVGKLQYWSDQIDQIFLDNPQRDPLSICLHNTCKNNPLPKYLFQKMINYRKQQVEKQEFANLVDMATAAEANRGSQFLLFLRLMRMDIDNQELKQLTELSSQAVGITDYLRRVPFTLQNYKLNLPEDIKFKHSINVRSLWDRIRGEPKEELYDAVLEVAAFARTQMIKTFQYQNKIPTQSFRAFLHLIPSEQYLEELEYYNFKIFEKAINQNSYVQLPITLFKNCRKMRFLNKEYDMK